MDALGHPQTWQRRVEASDGVENGPVARLLNNGIPLA